MKEVRTAFTLEEREEIENLLIAHAIEYKVVQDRKLHENVYTINTTGTFYKIEVEDALAPQALEILNAYYDAADDDDSILQQFDDNDLIEIIAYPRDYSTAKVNKAKAILLKRGFIGEDIAQLAGSRISADNQPQRTSGWAIAAGYFFAFIGGLLGFAIGWFLYFGKTKHTLTGEKYYAHDEYTRRHGRNIMVAGIIIWLLVLFYIPYYTGWLGFTYPM